MRIALLGSNGFVGSALLAELGSHPNLEISPVTRSNYASAQADGRYDILINAAMPSKRFAAASNPMQDFSESVEKTARLVNEWRWQKFVQISSISARAQRDTVYGRHKAAAEDVCSFGSNLIVRLGPMYDRSLTKGVLMDMLHDRRVYVSSDSEYGFAPLCWVAKSVVQNLGRAGILEIGARDGMRLSDVAKAISSASTFEGVRDDQVPLDPPSDAPPASAVIDFLTGLRLAT